MSAFEDRRKTAMTLVSPPYIAQIIQHGLNQSEMVVILNINIAQSGGVHPRGGCMYLPNAKVISP